ncbi:follicle-stimulating hormone receptor-like [Aplysia californica]|uniref:Follicle-stimulating hormone receptor-like n=1 Tax=Aplysia californica TaxID=6500 RepID=A0ABM1VPU1_APLCA|nr:follicle-stimulating hormone receptor-like [Aplysia californica]
MFSSAVTVEHTDFFLLQLHDLPSFSLPSPGYVCFIMVFNGISFFIILTCYLVMYISIRDSQAWNSNDTRVAKRMALLVFTDFLCWAPIAFLSLAAAFGKNLIHLNEAKVRGGQ